MKCLTNTCLLLMLVFATTAQAKPAISLKVVADSKKTKKVNNEYGDTDKVQKQAVNITLFNMGETETVTVQWLFIAQNKQNQKLWTYSYDAETCELKKGERKSITATSEKLVAKSYDIYFGVDSQPYGYVVVVFQGKDIIKCEATSQPLKKKCSDWAGFEEMLNATPTEEE